MMGELLSQAAAALGGVVIETHAASTRFVRDGAFAVLEATGAAFRLGPEIAEAALRTPGTAPSERGGDWIRFAPESWERFDQDRASAWFEMAWRLAEGRDEPG